MASKFRLLIAGLFIVVFILLMKSIGNRWTSYNIQDQHVEPAPTFYTKFSPYVESDKTKRFGIMRNVYKSTDPFRENDVAIVTHMDPSRIRNVQNLANSWQGPVHVCIFVTSEYLLNRTTGLVNRLREMDVNTKKFVNWHVLYPLRVFGPKYEHYVADPSFNGTKKVLAIPQTNTYSTTFEEDLTIVSELSHKMGLKGSTPDHLSFYPQTTAMNVALQSTKTLYFLSIDSDMSPSENLRKKFISFAEKHNLFAKSKTYPPYSKVGRNKKDSDGVCFDHHTGSLPPPDLYVVPAFMTKDSEPPKTVKQLRASVTIGNTTHFFAGVYEPSYSRTRHLDWLKQSEDAEDASAECLYEVEYKPEYEPFVIARNSIPPYDERFSGYSPVENHHKRLLGILGYKYKVLRNVFLVHAGWKIASINNTPQKDKEHAFHGKDWTAFLGEISKLANQKVYDGFLD